MKHISLKIFEFLSLLFYDIILPCHYYAINTVKQE